MHASLKQSRCDMKLRSCSSFKITFLYLNYISLARLHSKTVKSLKIINYLINFHKIDMCLLSCILKTWLTTKSM